MPQMARHISTGIALLISKETPVRSLRLHRGLLSFPNHETLIVYAILKNFFEVLEFRRVLSAGISVNNAIVIIAYNF